MGLMSVLELLTGGSGLHMSVVEWVSCLGCHCHGWVEGIWDEWRTLLSHGLRRGNGWFGCCVIISSDHVCDWTTGCWCLRLRIQITVLHGSLAGWAWFLMVALLALISTFHHLILSQTDGNVVVTWSNFTLPMVAQMILIAVLLAILTVLEELLISFASRKVPQTSRCESLPSWVTRS